MSLLRASFFRCIFNSNATTRGRLHCCRSKLAKARCHCGCQQCQRHCQPSGSRARKTALFFLIPAIAPSLLFTSMEAASAADAALPLGADASLVAPVADGPAPAAAPSPPAEAQAAGAAAAAGAPAAAAAAAPAAKPAYGEGPGWVPLRRSSLIPKDVYMRMVAERDQRAAAAAAPSEAAL